MKRTFAAFLVVSLAAIHARAEDPAACVDNAERGQAVRDAGKLLEARELFVQCSQASCPAPVRKACVQWLLDLDGRIPSIVPSARDVEGRDVADARLSIDGIVVPGPANGGAIRVDPGRHVVVFEHAGRRAEEAIVAREGERARIVEVVLPSGAVPLAPARNERARPAARGAGGGGPTIPTAAFVLGGVGVVGVGLFGYLAATGASDYASLRDTCSPHCAHDDVARIRTRFAIADISLAVGAAALTAAAILILGAHWPAAGARTDVAVVPARDGAAATVRFTF